MDKFDCPNCGHAILENNKITKSHDIVVKSRIVFLNEDKKVLAKCNNCKKIIGLPFEFVKDKIIVKRKVEKVTKII